jgi:hypothetical protein
LELSAPVETERLLGRDPSGLLLSQLLVLSGLASPTDMVGPDCDDGVLTETEMLSSGGPDAGKPHSSQFSVE